MTFAVGSFWILLRHQRSASNNNRRVCPFKLGERGAHSVCFLTFIQLVPVNTYFISRTAEYGAQTLVCCARCIES